MRYVPGLRLNLMSTGVLDQQGFHYHGGDGKWKLTKGSLVVARGKMCCTLYKTYGKICKSELNAVEESSPSLWHRRLGHMSEKGLQMLAKKSLIPVAKGNSLDSCDYCLFGKQKKISFSKSFTRKENILDLVHSDVCGPMEVESLSMHQYFVTYIDDASRKVWVYLLKSKDQVFQTFTIFHTMVERETGRKLKCLRSDNGGEYTSHEFKDYCAKYDIIHEKTVPRTPQHNGVAERMNRTIMEKVRCMLKMAKLSKEFWGEAVKTACYLINRAPCVPLEFETPNGVWTGKDASYSHLRVFGCKAFAHVSKEQRSKLDDKALPCIFVGYGDEEFGYRLWDPKMKKFIRSRDVIFHKNQSIADFNKEVLPRNAATDSIIYDSPLQQESNVGLQGDRVEGVPDMVDVEAEDEGELDQGEQPVYNQAAVRRSTRRPIQSTKYPSSQYILVTNDGDDPYAKYILLTSDGEPESYEEAKIHQDHDKWRLAMESEMESLRAAPTSW